ncbi:MAG: radical SAM protein [Phycisphaerae bacterium]|jgi:wyosine [tRNA(Phe)-imidazoG37] synthetase (radical SAM superfamily)
MNRKKQKSEHIFGPVPSRRLGRSLGIDLIPHKTCTYDCIYCQVGHTTDKTTSRKAWVSVDEIIAELKDKLSSKPDCITLSGSGEPTLFAGCGELIKKIKQITDIPVAVITNGSILSEKSVRSELLNADIVVPSLDAGDEEIFQKVNKPAEGITFDKMLKGLIDFRSEFKKDKYWLEVFFIADLNDDDEQVEKMAACIAKIKPDKIQLNTVTRPPADDVKPVKKERLAEIAKKFGKNAEVIADFKTSQADSGANVKDTDIIEMLKRRPCSLDDIAAGLKTPMNEALKHIETLIKAGKIETARQNGKIYYKVV